MTTVDELWYRSGEATQRAEQAYHELRDRYEVDRTEERRRRVSRRRFRTLLDRLRRSGAPYGAHTAVYRPDGSLLLVRHEGVDMWVLPGGEVGRGESFEEAAARELDEEAGVEADYEGLAILARVDLTCDRYHTWGVLPIFRARAASIATEVTDPDDEISAARWFDELPEDTRDREQLVAWREAVLG